MNLLQDLDRVDVLAGQCTKEQLAALLHRLARTQSEQVRMEICRRLEETVSPKSVWPAASSSDLIASTEAVVRRLEEITEQDLRIVITEDYASRDWDDDDDDDSEEDPLRDYSDPDGILVRVAEACSQIHELVRAKAWDLALSLGERTLSLKPRISLDGRSWIYEDGDTISLSTAVANIAVHADLSTATLDTLYAAYQSPSGSPETMLEIFRLSGERRLRLEDLIRYAPTDLENFQDFLFSWAAFLVEHQEDSLSRELCREAVEFLSPEAQIRLAKSQLESRPEECLPLLNRTELSVEERYDLARRLLEKLDPHTMWYEDAILKAAELAAVLQKGPDEVEAYWFDAFRARPTACNWLRAVLNSRDPAAARAKLDSILAEEPLAHDRGGLAVRFFRGDFETAFREGMHPTEFLGWKGSFLREGFALFLGTLYPGEAYPPGLETVMGRCPESIGFFPERYGMGLPFGAERQFRSCFRKWKEIVPWPEDLPAGTVLDHFEAVMQERIRAITRIRSVRSYPECASIVAAIGEVREALGEAGAKQRILDGYAKTYARFSRLRSELENFGWKR